MVEFTLGLSFRLAACESPLFFSDVEDLLSCAFWRRNIVSEWKFRSALSSARQRYNTYEILHSNFTSGTDQTSRVSKCLVREALPVGNSFEWTIAQNIVRRGGRLIASSRHRVLKIEKRHKCSPLAPPVIVSYLSMRQHFTARYDFKIGSFVKDGRS